MHDDSSWKVLGPRIYRIECEWLLYHGILLLIATFSFQKGKSDFEGVFGTPLKKKERARSLLTKVYFHSIKKSIFKSNLVVAACPWTQLIRPPWERSRSNRGSFWLYIWFMTHLRHYFLYINISLRLQTVVILKPVWGNSSISLTWFPKIETRNS